MPFGFPSGFINPYLPTLALRMLVYCESRDFVTAHVPERGSSWLQLMRSAAGAGCAWNEGGRQRCCALLFLSRAGRKAEEPVLLL